MRLYIEMQPLNFTLTLLFYFLFFTSFLFTFHLLPTPSSFHAASSGVDRAGTDPWTGQGRKAAGTDPCNDRNPCMKNLLPSFLALLSPIPLMRLQQGWSAGHALRMFSPSPAQTASPSLKLGRNRANACSPSRQQTPCSRLSHRSQTAHPSQ